MLKGISYMLDYQKVLSEFTYKPNFSIRISKQEGQWRLLITMWVEDSRGPISPWLIEQRPREFESVFVDDGLYRRFNTPIAGYSPSRPLVQVNGNFVIPPFEEGYEHLFLEWLVSMIRMLEDHEIDEWARYKGELLHDPHTGQYS